MMMPMIGKDQGAGPEIQMIGFFPSDFYCLVQVDMERNQVSFFFLTFSLCRPLPSSLDADRAIHGISQPQLVGFQT